MALSKSRVVSAQVVFRSAGGKTPGGTSIITSSTVGDLAPTKDVLQRALAVFQSAGFTTGPMVGISFSIAGRVDKFERIFHVQLRERKPGGVEAVTENGSVTADLPLDRLPGSLYEFVTAVTFPRPPEFGPGAP